VFKPTDRDDGRVPIVCCLALNPRPPGFNLGGAFVAAMLILVAASRSIVHQKHEIYIR
jgi:hypothetical protein